MARILLLSNGHGEDLSGSIIGTTLRQYGHEIEALPLVGKGHAYLGAGIKRIFKVKEFSTGGLGYTSFRGRLTELLQGQLFYLLGLFIRLKLISRQYDLFVVIGDLVPVLVAWLVGRPTVAYMVAYSSHYEGNLQLPWPCENCLRSKRFLKIYSRDKLTEIDLNVKFESKVEFLGNPFMEPVFNCQQPLPKSFKRLGILPGSRRPELDENLKLLLRGLEYSLSQNLNLNDLSIDIALVHAYDDLSLNKLAVSFNTNLKPSLSDQSLKYFHIKECKINFYRNNFISLLQSSDVLLSMSGTAAEQAVGISKPVVQMKGYGPQFTTAFAEAQRRLLGPTVFCAPGKVGSNENLFKTFVLILDLMEKVRCDDNFKDQMYTEAEMRLGAQGGAYRMAESINSLLTSNY